MNDPAYWEGVRVLIVGALYLMVLWLLRGAFGQGWWWLCIVGMGIVGLGEALVIAAMLIRRLRG